MAQAIMEMNRGVLLQLSFFRDHLNAASALHLFANVHNPAPADTAAAFTAPTHDTYAPQDLTGQWAAPVLDQAGQYSIRTDPRTWPAPTVGPTVLIRGFYVTDAVNVLFAALFPAPSPLAPGGAPLLFRPVFQKWASMILLTNGG